MKTVSRLLLPGLSLLVAVALSAAEKLPEAYRQDVEKALKRAGDNASEIRSSFDKIDADDALQLESLAFLVAYMPVHDLQSLKGDFLAENVRMACQARAASEWGKSVPKELFLNDVVPYANVNERRDNWRKDFFERFMPLVEEAKSPGEAAQILNRDIWKIVNVRYHATKRPKPDQSPYESIDANFASCTGLSILLIDACRAVGVPARFVGIPQWANKRGNHSWVEVWDGESWKFTGACEYNAGGLGRAWFAGDASKAIKSERMHSVYAASWKPADALFPLIWNLKVDYVNAFNVTDSYARSTSHRVFLQVFERPKGGRTARSVIVLKGGKEVAKGRTRDATNDTNDMLAVELKAGEYTLQIEGRDDAQSFTVRGTKDEEHRFFLSE